MKDQDKEKETGWIPIAREGTFQDMRGRTHQLTGQKLDQIAAAYNNRGDNFREAPIVIGHPKDNSPAWGWISEAKRIGNRLCVKARDVIPAFVQAVKAKAYKYVSPSIRPDMTLQHVGFLGGQAPAIPGLGEVGPAFANFSEFDQEAAAFSFDFAELYDNPWYWVVQALRGFREYIFRKEGEEEARKYISNWQVDQLLEKAIRQESHFSEESGGSPPGEGNPVGATPRGRPTHPGPSQEGNPGMQSIDTGEAMAPPISTTDMQKDDENVANPSHRGAENMQSNDVSDNKENHMKEEEKNKTPQVAAQATPAADKGAQEETASFAEVSQALKAYQKEADGLRTELTQFRRDQKAREVAAFCEQLIKEGKVVPKKKHELMTFMLNLDDSDSINFAEGEQKDEKSQQAWFKAFCEELPEIVPLKRLPRPDGSAVVDDDMEFAEADPEQMALHRQIKALQKKEGISYTDAFSRIRR